MPFDSSPSSRGSNPSLMASSLEAGPVAPWCLLSIVACKVVVVRPVCLAQVCLAHPKDIWMAQPPLGKAHVHNASLSMHWPLLECCNQHWAYSAQTTHTSDGLSMAQMCYHGCPCNANTTAPLPQDLHRENAWARRCFQSQISARSLVVSLTCNLLCTLTLCTVSVYVCNLYARMCSSHSETMGNPHSTTTSCLKLYMQTMQYTPVISCCEIEIHFNNCTINDDSKCGNR